MLGSIAAMARWFGTEILELTVMDNGFCPRNAVQQRPIEMAAFLTASIRIPRIDVLLPSENDP